MAGFVSVLNERSEGVTDSVWGKPGKLSVKGTAMADLIAAPQVLSAAAAEVSGIGVSVSAAHAAAASSTTAVVPAGADEISTSIAAVFSRHGQQFATLGAQASVFHTEFAQALTAAGGAYAATEVANVSPLQTLPQHALAMANAPTNALLGRPLIGNGTSVADDAQGQAGQACGVSFGNGGAGGARTGAGYPGGAGGAAGPSGAGGTGGTGGPGSVSVAGTGGPSTASVAGGAGGPGGWLLGPGGPSVIGGTDAAAHGAGGAGGVGSAAWLVGTGGTGGSDTAYIGVGGAGGYAGLLYGPTGATGAAAVSGPALPNPDNIDGTSAIVGERPLRPSSDRHRRRLRPGQDGGRHRGRQRRRRLHPQR